MTSSLSKTVLIEQAELDRLQQRQLRENSSECQAMVRLLHNMRIITGNKKLTAGGQLHSIVGLQIKFVLRKKETELLSHAISPHVAREATPPSPPVIPKDLADKVIGPEIQLEEEEEQEQYQDLLEVINKSAQASALSPIMAKVIRWNLPGLYQQKAHRLLKKITKHQDILTRNENGEAVVYGVTIPGSNFKSPFKSLVSNQQNLNQVGIDEFLRALQSINVKKDEICSEPLKIKYSSVALFSTDQRHSKPTKYKDEEEYDDYEEVIRLPTHKHRVYKDKKTSSSSLAQRGKGYVHKPPGRKPNILYVY